jgi:hypothetical protein
MQTLLFGFLGLTFHGSVPTHDAADVGDIREAEPVKMDDGFGTSASGKAIDEQRSVFIRNGLDDLVDGIQRYIDGLRNMSAPIFFFGSDIDQFDRWILNQRCGNFRHRKRFTLFKKQRHIAPHIYGYIFENYYIKKYHHKQADCTTHAHAGKTSV